VRVFIVGATGLLGRAVIPALVERGDEVVALVRSLERAAPIAGPSVQLFEGDLLTEPPDRLESMLAGCDAAAHLATALRPGSPGLGTTNTNSALRIAGTRRLLHAALAANVQRYVQQSIALAYIDGGDTWLDEETPFYQPENPAGAAQPIVEMEAMVRAVDPGQMAWVILRGGSFVGPGTRQDQTISDLKAGTLKVPGDGSNWVSFVHYGDYGEAVDLAIHGSARGVVLNVADEPVRSGEYLDRLAQLMNLPAPSRDASAPLPRSYRCTSETAKTVFGWVPTIGIWPQPPQ